MENEVKKMIRAKVSNSLTFLKQDKGKWIYWNHSKMDFGFWSYILIEVDIKGKD